MTSCMGGASVACRPSWSLWSSTTPSNTLSSLDNSPPSAAPSSWVRICPQISPFHSCMTSVPPSPIYLHCCVPPDEEGPEGLTQFLLLEVRKLREQLRGSRVCERRLSQRCRVAEEERSRAERKTLDLRHDRLQMERYTTRNHTYRA